MTDETSPMFIRPGVIAMPLFGAGRESRGDNPGNLLALKGFDKTPNADGERWGRGLLRDGVEWSWVFQDYPDELATDAEREAFFAEWLSRGVEPGFPVDGWEDYKAKHRQPAPCAASEGSRAGRLVHGFPPAGSVLCDSRDGEIIAIRARETDEDYAIGASNGAERDDFRNICHIRSNARWMRWATPEQAAGLFAFWRSQNWQPDFPVDGWVQWVAEQQTQTGQEPPKSDLAAVGLQALRDLGKAVEDANTTFATAFAKERKKRLKLAKRVKKLEQTLNDRDLSARLTALESLLKGSQTDDPAFKLTGIKIIRETAVADPDAKLSFEALPEWLRDQLNSVRGKLIQADRTIVGGLRSDGMVSESLGHLRTALHLIEQIIEEKA